MKNAEVVRIIDWIAEKKFQKDDSGKWYHPNNSQIRYTTHHLIKLYKLNNPK